jgi:3-deoxy-D-manno-octulosonate 8-phosphate phosphatase (KDO 8-P phosphatase)
MENFILDVDGVLAAKEVIYTREGKTAKIFGPDDSDALNILRDKLNIIFVSGDKRGFEISKKRVEDMGFEIYPVSTHERLDWIKNKGYNTEKTIYMGDGIFDPLVFEGVKYSIAPGDSFLLTKQKADFTTISSAGRGAVAEAVVHILSKFFNITKLEPSKKYGTWKK